MRQRLPALASKTQIEKGTTVAINRGMYDHFETVVEPKGQDSICLNYGADKSTGLLKKSGSAAMVSCSSVTGNDTVCIDNRFPLAAGSDDRAKEILKNPPKYSLTGEDGDSCETVANYIRSGIKYSHQVEIGKQVVTSMPGYPQQKPSNSGASVFGFGNSSSEYGIGFEFKF